MFSGFYGSAVLMNRALQKGVGGFGDRVWQESELLAYLRENPPKGRLLSNVPHAVYLLAHQTADFAPQVHPWRIPTVDLDVATQIRSEMEKVDGTTLLLAWFNHTRGDYAFAEPEELQNAGFMLEKIWEGEDGILYTVRAQNEADLAEIRRELACMTEPEPVVVRPTPPVTDLASFCRVFREIPDVALRATGCEWAAQSSNQLWGLDVDPPGFLRARIAGLGTPTDIVTQPFTAVGIQALGVAPVDVQAWFQLATQLGIQHVERWPVVIPDPYHGTPGLVVRTDIAFQYADHWEICMGPPSELLTDNEVIPLYNLTCTPDGDGYRRCVEKEKPED
jgi:hypothetical protein